MREVCRALTVSGRHTCVWVRLSLAAIRLSCNSIPLVIERVFG
jgi:hypothetical protein